MTDTKNRTPVREWPVVLKEDRPRMLWALEAVAYIPRENCHVLYAEGSKEILDSVSIMDVYATQLSHRDLPPELQMAFFRAIDALQAAQATIQEIFKAGQQWPGVEAKKHKRKKKEQGRVK